MFSWSPCWGRGSWLHCFSLVCGLCTVCHGLFALPLSVIDRIWFVIVAFLGYLLCYFWPTTEQRNKQLLAVKRVNNKVFYKVTLDHPSAVYSKTIIERLWKPKWASISENVASDIFPPPSPRPPPPPPPTPPQSDQNNHWAHFWTTKDATFLHVDNEDSHDWRQTWPRGYKTFFMLNSAENFSANKYDFLNLKLFFMLNSAVHENFPANKYENPNNSWHFHIY